MQNISDTAVVEIFCLWRRKNMVTVVEHVLFSWPLTEILPEERLPEHNSVGQRDTSGGEAARSCFSWYQLCRTHTQAKPRRVCCRRGLSSCRLVFFSLLCGWFPWLLLNISWVPLEMHRFVPQYRDSMYSSIPGTFLVFVLLSSRPSLF